MGEAGGGDGEGRRTHRRVLKLASHRQKTELGEAALTQQRQWRPGAAPVRSSILDPQANGREGGVLDAPASRYCAM